jgi:acyl-CoA synthetase (AMP-forming)/AMP-acid ligase II
MDRVCIPVPFYHCFGMVLGNRACTTHGATMVVTAPTFDAAMTLRTMDEVTICYGMTETSAVSMQTGIESTPLRRRLGATPPPEWCHRSTTQAIRGTLLESSARRRALSKSLSFTDAHFKTVGQRR